MIQRLGLALVMVWLLVACGGNGGALPPTEVPVAEPGVVDPNAPLPEARLHTSNGETHAGTPGTYCWAGTCADMIGVPVPPEPIRVSPGEELSFEFTAGQPTHLTLRVLAWQPSDVPSPSDEVLIADAEAPLVESGNLSPATEVAWQALPEPGEYVLHLFSSYSSGQGGGDIAYGWHILVE